MKSKNAIVRILSILLVVCLLTISLAGCGAKSKKINSIDDLNDRSYKITVDSGSAAANTAFEKFSKAEFVYAPSISDAYMSVSKGKTDAFVYGRIFMQYALASGSVDNLVILEETLDTTDIGVGISKNNADLLDDVNDFISESKQNGVLDDMYERWIIRADDMMPDLPKAANPVGTLKIGTSGLVEPITYYDAEQNLKGYDIEFIYRLASFMNMDVELEAMGYDALVASLESERLDMVIADLNITPERQQVIIMSDPYRTTETAVAVRKDMVDNYAFEKIDSLDKLNGKNIGLIAGSSYEADVQKRLPDSKIEYYITYAELIAAMDRGRIDAYITDEAVANKHKLQKPNLYNIDEGITYDDYAFMLNPNNQELLDNIDNTYESLNSKGEIKKLEEKWLTGNSNHVLNSNPNVDTSKGTLHIITCADQEPYAFIKEDKITGFEIELMSKIANEMGYDVQFSNSDFSSLMPSLLGGKYDVALGCISVTPERQESISFSKIIHKGKIVAVLEDNSIASGGLFNNIKDSFIRTFVTESRWKLILDGFIMTIELSIVSAVFGTLLGFLFSFPLRSKNKIISGLSKSICTIHDGLPILIVLMIFYYIIFSKTSVPAAAIGIIAFSIDFANVVAATLNTGVNAVDKGEIEAAYAMGYNKWQVFTKIILPQAARQMSGAYNGAIIGLIKGTSVVGFITVTDLTKAGDIIRSRTYEAFFPLIVVAVIYFILSNIIVKLLKIFEKKLEPKSDKKRKIKGVNTND